MYHIMNHVDTEKLIKLVSRHPYLYDAKNKDYGDLHKRETTWQRIGKDLGVKAETCKAKWNILRGGYRRALRNRESGCSFAGRKWRFEDDMSFLKECVMERRRVSTRGDDAASEEEEFITIVKEEPSEIVYDGLSDNVPEEEWTRTSSCGSAVNEAETVAKASKSEKKEDPEEADGVRQFFLAMAETVKTLPPIVQVQIKAEVFKVVNAAELAHVQEKTRGLCENGDTDHTYIQH